MHVRSGGAVLPVEVIHARSRTRPSAPSSPVYIRSHLAKRLPGKYAGKMFPAL